MTSKERMRLAMQGQKPDRPPVMCQLSLGHLAKNFVDDLVPFWYTSEGLGEAFIKAAEAYQFDGILVNTYGRDPAHMRNIAAVEDQPGNAKLVTWKNGSQTYIPYNDDPRPFGKAPKKTGPSHIDDLDIESIPRYTADTLPAHQFDILKYVLARKSKDLSIHGEVGTGFEMFLMLFDSEASGLMALLDDPEKAKVALDRLNDYVILLATEQCKLGIDAMKLSSPFAGAGFISRDMYEEFVLPYEKKIISAVHDGYGVPCYIHTCGHIGDRLDLMLATGTDGLECLDPPPLGSVDLKTASAQLGSRAFIKGNLDSVNELLGVSVSEAAQNARKKLEIGSNHAGGYILSTACSVAPNVAPENIKILTETAKEFAY